MSHPSEEEMAGAIDGSLAEPRRAEIFDHLRVCGACFESFRDCAIERGLWEFDRSRSVPDPELVAAGMRVAETHESRPARRGHSTRRDSWLGSRRRLALGGVLAALALLWGGVVIERLTTRDLDGQDGLLAPIIVAVETASGRGRIVIPGAELSRLETDIVYRSGYAQLNDSLSASLRELHDRYQEGTITVEEMRWLIAGHIASGQLSTARDLAADAAKRTPDDVRIAGLRALVAFMGKDYETAERLFNEVLSDNPDDPAAGIDYALMLAERGKGHEARLLLTRVADRHAGTPIARRARALLESVNDR